VELHKCDECGKFCDLSKAKVETVTVIPSDYWNGIDEQIDITCISCLEKEPLTTKEG